jgi:hypothetical protein
MNKEPLPEDDIQLIERVIIYDPETGQILGTHIFGACGKPSDEARRQFEGILQRDVADWEKRRKGKVALHRSDEANRLTSLHHRVDVRTGRLVDIPAPLRVKVE